MTLDALDRLARAHSLEIFGVCRTVGDKAPNGSIVLLGPHEPGFWDHVTAEPEFSDEESDPLDRWSKRVISSIAGLVGGLAYFPFDWPAHPFFEWAVATGRAWSSPVKLLVHDQSGLMVSYRGAVLLPGDLSSRTLEPSPCRTCQTRACLTACPVSALTGDGYNVEQCRAFLDTEAGENCLLRGCAVRRACPLSQNYGRSELQSAYHMRCFHKCP